MPAFFLKHFKKKTKTLDKAMEVRKVNACGSCVGLDRA
jgi:hypothetical protein